MKTKTKLIKLITEANEEINDKIDGFFEDLADSISATIQEEIGEICLSYEPLKKNFAFHFPNDKIGISRAFYFSSASVAEEVKQSIFESGLSQAQIESVISDFRNIVTLLESDANE